MLLHSDTTSDPQKRDVSRESMAEAGGPVWGAVGGNKGSEGGHGGFGSPHRAQVRPPGVIDEAKKKSHTRPSMSSSYLALLVQLLLHTRVNRPSVESLTGTRRKTEERSFHGGRKQEEKASNIAGHTRAAK